MPGKPFYSMEEVCEKLGKTQDQVKSLVREGALREFRDAGKVFFKAEDIDKLAASRGGLSSEDTGEILLEAAPEPEPELPSLADSSGGTSIIGLEPLPEDEPEEQKKKKEDTVITASGIGVFDDDELEIDADPMAKTQITSGAVDDQVTLESAGSGSGLLDLAREADDTALGADLLDEIYPGEEEAAAPAARAPAAAEEAAEEEAAEPALEAAEGGEVVLPALTSAADPAEGMMAGLLVGGLVVMAAASTVIAGVLQGFLPDYGRYFADGARFFYFLGGAVGVVVLALLGGWLTGRALTPKRR